MEDFNNEPNGTLSKTVCFVCRQRKVRCDKKLPKCDGCKRAKVECQYVKVKHKPGLRAGYVSELEQRLVKVERELQHMQAEKSDITARMDRLESMSRPHVAASESVTDITDNGVPTASSSASSSSQFSPHSHHARSSLHSPSRASLNVDLFSHTTLHEICHVWFENYHSWIPILHQPSLLEQLNNAVPLASTAHHIVFKAIAAVTLPHTSLHIPLNPEEQDKISSDLRDQIVLEAAKQLSLQSMQALIIVCIREWGAGRLSQLWNLIALAKRIGTQLGLRDLVANHCSNFNQSSNLPPRMLPLPHSLVNQEEKIRAYWMAEVLDCSSTIGAAWNLTISEPSSTGLLPCNDANWSVISLWSFGEFEMPSAYSLLVMLVSNELYHVHQFLQKSFDLQSSQDRLRRKSKCEAVDRRLLDWRQGFISSNAQLKSDHRSDFDPNIVLTQCILDLAVISLYQRVALPATVNGEVQEDSQHAMDRCLQACDSITDTLRELPDTELMNMSPLIISCIFVPSRFYLVHAKLLNIEIPANLDVLLHSLEISGRRWSYARRLEKVLRAEILQHSLPPEMTTLPLQFYDLQYSNIDIDEALRVSAEGLEPWMHLLGLDHPALDTAAILSTVQSGGDSGTGRMLLRWREATLKLSDA